MGEVRDTIGATPDHPVVGRVGTGSGGQALVRAALRAGLIERLLSEQRRVMGLSLDGESPQRCLAELCLSVERIDPTLRAAIVIVDTTETRWSQVIAPTVAWAIRALRGSSADEPTADRSQAAPADPPRGDDPAIAGLAGQWRALSQAHGLAGGFATPMVIPAVEADDDRLGMLAGWVLIATTATRETTDDDRRIGHVAAGVGALLVKKIRRASQPASCVATAIPDMAGLVSRAIEAVPAALYMTDADGRVTLYNRAAVALWGREPVAGDQWCGSWKIFRPDGAVLELDQCPMAIALREKRAVMGQEIVIERPDGTRRHVAPHPHPLFDDHGELTGAVNLLVDVTDRRLSQQALRLSEERYRSLAQASSSIVWTADAQGRFVEPQPSWTEYTGQQWESMSREGGRVMVHPDDRDRVREEFEAAGRSRAPYRNHGRLWHAASGTYRRFESRGVPLLNPDGSVREWIGTCHDVEDREQAHEALRHNETRYRAIVESQSEMVCRFRADGTIVFANGAYARVRGVCPEALVGTNLWGFVHGSDRSEVAALLARITPDQPEVRIENRVGTDQGTRWTLWTNRGLEFDRRGQPVELQATGIDITERKLIENALRESEERFRVMANAAPVKIWISGTDRQFTWFNKRWLDFVGRPMEHEIGDGWTQNVHPEDLGLVLEALSRAFEQRRMFSLEYRLRRRDGEYRWLIDQGVPVYDARGEFAGFIGSALDITTRRLAEQDRERHKVELEALVEQRSRELHETFDRLRMSERLAMMGTLSAGLGHDMGNLLLPLRIRLDSLETHVSSQQGREDIDAIRTAAEYLRRLASGLRLLSIDSSRPSATQATNLRAWWEEAEGVFRSVLPRGVGLESDLAPTLPDVAISKAGLTQIVFNLVQNAGDATRDRASGVVRVTARSLEGRGADGNTAEPRVVLSVIDDGPGMTPEVRARCMEPFYTTKALGISTGLGLSLVSSLMREAGGVVELESKVGLGTTFRLSLPVNTHPTTPTAHATGGCAIVKIRDPRMRSFVCGELKAMGVATSDEAPHSPDAVLLVVDDPARLGDAPAGASAICLGGDTTPPREGIVCLPPNPGILSVRNALRDWVRAARPTAASPTGA